jgi:hypothetical protein
MTRAHALEQVGSQRLLSLTLTSGQADFSASSRRYGPEPDDLLLSARGRDSDPRIEGVVASIGARNAGYRPALAKDHAVNSGRTRMDICEHMKVVDADNQHVGIVEKVEGDRIKLSEKDALDPQNLFLDKSQVAGVEGNKVRLSQKVSAVTTRAFLSPEQ